MIGRPSTLPVFAKKEDGTLRTAIDYRGVNFYLLADNQSIPNIAEVLDPLQRHRGTAAMTARVDYSCYDCSSGSTAHEIFSSSAECCLD